MKKSNDQNKTSNINTEEIKLTVNSDKTIEQAIEDGNYYWKNSDITVEHFPVTQKPTQKKTEVIAKIFHFNCNMNHVDIALEMDKENYRTADTMELLVLGATYPELQKKFPIIALGSLWHDVYRNYCVPCLFSFNDKRRFYLAWFVKEWNTNFYFLGIRR
jgi:hypothetical protein